MELWDLKNGTAKFDWGKRRLRYRPPWRWRWGRIYATAFWLGIVPLLICFDGWR